MRVVFFNLIILLCVGVGGCIAGCSSMEEVDRSYVNLPQMDVRSANALGQPSPKTGLRDWASQSGQSSCSVCAH